MLRVKLFCDWDDDPFSMLVKFRHLTDGFSEDFKYKNIQFVYDESYDFTVIFNFPVMPFNTPPERSIALILEPPEILDVFYGHVRSIPFDNVCKIYSFADDKWETAYGIGFSTVPNINYLELTEKPLNACMIASNKRLTPFHNRRHEILDALINSGLNIDFYGRGMGTGSDPRIKGEIAPMRKYEILNQYRFCIDFENSPFNAVTDKFFDPVQCNTVPITNAKILKSILPNGGFEYIDFDWSLNEIVNRIHDIINQMDLTSYVEPLNIAKNEVRSGNMNIVEWIYRKVNELNV